MRLKEQRPLDKKNNHLSWLVRSPRTLLLALSLATTLFIPTLHTQEELHAITGGEIEAPSVESLTAQDEALQQESPTPSNEEDGQADEEMPIEELSDASGDAAQSEAVQKYVGNIINSPYLSTKCRSLLRKRQARLELKQEAVGLQKRIANLRTQAKSRQESLLKKLEYIDSSLARKVILFQEEITNMNEEIVKKGCPGVTL